MKYSVLIGVTLVLFFGLPAFSSAGEGGTPATTTAKDASLEKEQYEKSMEERLRKVGKDLDELKAKAATKTVQVRKEMGRYFSEAEKKQKAASRKLEEMRKSSAEKWKKFSSEMGQAMDDFEKAYDKAKSRFKD